MQWLARFAIRAIFPGIREAELEPFVAQMMRESPLLMRLGIHVASLLFLLTPIATVYLPVPAVLLPKGLLDKHADRLLTHRVYALRMLPATLKFVGGICWAMSPEVREQVGMKKLAPDPGTWKEGTP